MSLLFAAPGNEQMARKLASLSGRQLGKAEFRRFPDGESYVRIFSDVAGRDTAIVCTLARPDGRFLRLVYAARLLRELGARRVRLIAPYLPYLRQDARFRPGEAFTSRHFADLVGREVDSLVTITPHLHRYKSLSEVYALPAEALSAAPLLGDWVKSHVSDPVIVGPDAESAPWAMDIGRAAGAPSLVFSKQRSGDRDVAITAPEMAEHAGRQPVLVDDIVSSGATIEAAVHSLRRQGFPAPICVIVHALFGADAQARLTAAGCRLVSTDTVPHPTNRIPVAPLLADWLRDSNGEASVIS